MGYRSDVGIVIGAMTSSNAIAQLIAKVHLTGE